MIVFNKLWKTMKEKGVSTYTLREKCDIDSKTVRRLRANENVETKTLNRLCAVLHCRLEDIAEFVPDAVGERGEDNNQPKSSILNKDTGKPNR